MRSAGGVGVPNCSHVWAALDKDEDDAEDVDEKIEVDAEVEQVPFEFVAADQAEHVDGERETAHGRGHDAERFSDRLPFEGCDNLGRFEVHDVSAEAVLFGDGDAGVVGYAEQEG